MRHFFILGSNPALSAAEILAALSAEGSGRRFEVAECGPEVLIIDMPDAFDGAAFMARLGGTIKIGTLLSTDAPGGVFPMKEEAVIDASVAALERNIQTRGRGDKPVTFGFSFYGLSVTTGKRDASQFAGQFSKLGMEVKRHMKEAGRAARWVKAQEGTALTSVVVGKNRLIEEGAEFVVLVTKSGLLLGTTTAVQPFEEFSQTDYGRPSRDMVQGMLPPKLARIMINLTGIAPSADKTLLDPFCGGGTMLTEAARIGFRHLEGSDKNATAVEATEKNIAWMRERKLLADDAVVTVRAADSRDVGKHLEAASVDAVVTEPFLGPPRLGKEKRGDLQRELHDLTRLYYESISAWHKVLRPGAPIVMALPTYLFKADQGRNKPPIIEKHGILGGELKALGLTFEPLLPASVMARLGAQESKNRGIMYGRAEQYVWREIVRIRFDENAPGAKRLLEMS